MNDPQIAARGMIREKDHPRLGKLRRPNLPFKFSGYDLGVPKARRSLGATMQKWQPRARFRAARG